MGTRVHHIGIVVKEIRAAAEEFVDMLGYEIRSAVIHDPVQTAFCQFLKLPHDSSYVELVAPDGEHSKLLGALKRGNALNHLCFATDDIEKSCEHFRARSLILICEPVLAAAFPGRRIAWMMGEARLLTELVEEGTDTW